MNDFITQQFSSYNLFQAAGDVVELNAWVHARVSPVNEYHRTYNE
jgi:hypothetical protein